MRFTKLMAGMLAATLIVPVIANQTKADENVIELYLLSDRAFMNYLLPFDKDNDRRLNSTELAAITELNMRDDAQLTNITAIKYMPNLKRLNIMNTNVEGLDLRNNPKIEMVITENAPLQYCMVDGCSNLVHLNVHHADIDNLNISDCPKLQYLDISNTKLKSIDISNCPKLISQRAIPPTIKQWDKNVDVECKCHGSYSYGISGVYLSYNTTTIVREAIPAGSYDICSTFKDPEMRKFFSDSFYDRNQDGLLSQDEINACEVLDVYPDDYITDLTGLEIFKNVIDLTLRGIDLKSFDASPFTNLTKLSIYSPCPSSPDSYLDIRSKTFDELDISKNLKLESVDVENGSDNFKISGNSNIKDLYLEVRRAELIDFDFSKYPQLKKVHIYCSTDELMDLSSNDHLEDVYYFGNLKLSNNLKTLTNLQCSKLIDLNDILKNNTDLKSVEIRGKNDIAIDISSLVNLEKLNITGFTNTSLDLSKLPNLRNIEIHDLPITELDLRYLPPFQNVDPVDFKQGSKPNQKYFGFYSGDYGKFGYFSIHVDTPVRIITQVNVPLPIPSVTPTPEVTPTTEPTTAPVKPTTAPTTAPSKTPTSAPTSAPNGKPTVAPTTKPGVTTAPKPTTAPGVTSAPTNPSATTTPSKPGATTTAPSKPTATPTPKPSKPQTGVSDKAGTVEDFAERLYTTCLGRDAEQAGKDYWVGELKAGKPGSEVARGFFFSPEFTGLNLSNEEYITRLYRTFMGREPDQDGMNYWLGEMKNGQGRVFVFDGFVNSPEWADICLTYGIRSGGLAEPTFEKQASKKVLAFAERLYTTCLGRDAEPEGLKYWSQELANLRQTGTVAASGFFNSPEFIGLNLKDDEYITRLYRTFMGREPEKSGYDYWMSELKAGKDRQSVFDGFSVAPEFANLCAEAGIMR